MKKTRIEIPKKVREAILTVIGVVLVWRGIWVGLDAIDFYILGGSHFMTALFGAFVGLGILYHLDKNLDELRAL